MGLSHTVSGDIASFRTPSRVPIESLKFHFLPKQASGTPTPENPIPIEGWTGLNGYMSGYNVLPFDSVIPENYTSELDGVTATYSNGIMHMTGNHNKAGWSNVIWFYTTWMNNPIVLPAGTYTVSKGLTVVCKIDDAEYANQGGTFTVKNRALVQGFYAAVRGEGSVDIYLPLVLTVGTKRPKKYLPYKPITDIPITFPVGKNLFDKDGSIEYGYISSNGEIVYSALGKYTTYYIPVQPSTDYVLSGISNDGVLTAVSAYTGDKQFISRIGSEFSSALQSSPIVFTTPANCQYIRINLPLLMTNYQLELGSSVTNYEQYYGFIYGGYVDILAGEIVYEYESYDLGNCDWHKSNSGSKFYASIPSYPYQAGLIMYCSNYKFDGYSNSGSGYYGDNYTFRYYYSLSYPHAIDREIYIHDDRYNSASDFKVAMKGVLLVYPLSEPIHIQISAQDLKAFLDHNNFWSDANDITEVTYAVTESKDILATRKKAMDFDMGHRKKVTWNQLVKDGNFTSRDHWLTSANDYGTVSVNDNIAAWTSTNPELQYYYHTGLTNKQFYLSIPENHRVLVKATVRSSVSRTDSTHRVSIFGMINYENSYSYTQNDVQANTWTDLFGFIRDNRTEGKKITRFKVCYGGNVDDGTIPVGTVLEVKNFMAFDLTQMFGLGNEPSTVEEFEHICEINGIDLTTYHPYDTGSDRWLIIP